jgi:tripartite-type tricarboxylate transporter receptor subunit TctC
MSAAGRTGPDPPGRPVRLITPNAGGGGPDFAIRLISAALRDRWKQPVIVDNRPGAEGILAVRAMIDAGDDHILMVAPTSVVTSASYVHERSPRWSHLRRTKSRLLREDAGLCIGPNIKWPRSGRA